MGQIPKLEDCQPGLIPTGFNLIVAVSPAEEKTAGGIILIDAQRDKNQLTEVRGRVVALSPACFDFADLADAKPKVGDAVQFAHLAGIVTEGADGKPYRVLQDKHITAIVVENGHE
jgi:chaperonin GroES